MQQDECAGHAADEGREAGGQDELGVRLQVAPVADDRGELAGPQGDGRGGVGLDGQHPDPQERREDQEATSAGHGIDRSGRKSCQRQPDVLKSRGKMHPPF